MLRTDLAIEAKEMYHENVREVTEIQGIKARSKEIDGITVSHIEVLDETGSNNIGKPIGNYYTLEIPEFLDFGYAYYYSATELLSSELKKILPDIGKKTALVVGLGNRHITSDALGPHTIDRVIVTRHLFEYSSKNFENLGSLCAIAPSVLGLTGVETADIVKGICEKISPGVVVLVDALASRKTERVATTIQMSDTGLNPGAGIGNHRKEITEKSLGVPVISIGVPMVVDAATVAYDAISELGLSTDIGDIDKYIKRKRGNQASFIVTPKDIDKLTKQMSNVISSAINITFHNIAMEDIESYLE